MPRASSNGIEIEYEVTGSGPPLVLIMGLAGQLTDWPEPFVAHLSESFTVVRFDNRDSGLSTWSDAPVPTRSQLLRAAVLRRDDEAAYRLADLADDTAGLMDELAIDQAHLVGISMGGMIAQLLAIAQPSRVRSLCSIMSTTGHRLAGRPSFRVLRALGRRGEAPTRAHALDASMELFRLVGGADWNEAQHRQRAARSIERAYNPGGIMRQSHAAASAPDRTLDLARIDVPTLVVHGLEDELVRPSGGVATSRAIPHSRLLMFPAMGHDLPNRRQPEIAEAIIGNADRVRPAQSQPGPGGRSSGIEVSTTSM